MFNESIEVDFVVWLQDRLGAWAEPIMQFFTILGYPIVYLVVVPLVYWCIDHRRGLRLAAFIFAGGLLNDIAKLALRSPRPFWVSSEVSVFSDTSGGFGMPSGHSQVAAPAWGFLIAAWKWKWSMPFAISVALLIGVSRIYFGVHFPSQIVVGLLAGLLILIAIRRYEASAISSVVAQPLATRLMLVVVATGVLTILGYLVARIGEHWAFPPAWLTNFEARTNGEEVFDPMSDHGLAYSAGSLLGTMIGAILQHQFVGFRSEGPLLQRLLRIPVGIVAFAVPAALVAVTFEVLGLDTGSATVDDAFGFTLTFSIFLGVFLVAPLIFQRLALCDATVGFTPARPPAITPQNHQT